MNDQFKGDWEAYLKRIENSSPKIRALGVTDYFHIGTYKAVVEHKKNGRLPEVNFIFPNVELRLNIETAKKKAINVHLLFSPEDPNHIHEIERALGRLTFPFEGSDYRCTESDLIALGRKFDKTQADDRGALKVGANQFKTSLADIRKLFLTEEWVRRNCLIAVSGNLGDGTAGLQEDASFAATRRELEKNSHIIFSSNASQRDFWLGKKVGYPREKIEEVYGTLKPCLHGSDAHEEEKVGSPDHDRYCWIKGDLDYETLRQVVIEPGERVEIGTSSPANRANASSIRSVNFSETPWIKTDAVPLNSGLVAIIGARGSGKTALADFVATGAGVEYGDLDETSFIRRAEDYLESSQVELEWGDGSKQTNSLLPTVPSWDDEARPQVCYLSQKFVERLCSAEGLAVGLRNEMERVVFEATDPMDKLEATDFRELADALLEPIHRRRADYEKGVIDATNGFVREGQIKQGLKKLEDELAELKKSLGKDEAEMKSLLPEGSQLRAKRLKDLEDAYNIVAGRIETLRRRHKRLSDLKQEVDQIRSTTEPSRLADQRARYQGTDLAEGSWQSFSMKFAGDVDGVISRALSDVTNEVDRQTKSTADGQRDVQAGTSLQNCPLEDLRVARDKAKEEVGIDARKRQRYEALQKTIAQKQASQRKLEADIGNAKAAPERQKQYATARREDYGRVFSTLIEEQEVLEDLYKPLRARLTNASGALAKLQFVVKRQVDLKAWVAEGESLLDLRKSSSFQGYGALEDEAVEQLLPAWTSGTADEVKTALDAFNESHRQDFVNAEPNHANEDEQKSWRPRVAKWLFGTSHIKIQYSIQYDGVAIEQLSPGTRGIVLLLLYLAVDIQDARPLIVDQPEENLDPKSVFTELVPHFRDARLRRQVIIVTHNANLVVNTDADQIIVAASNPSADGTLPEMTYSSGSIENPTIRHMVCDILEGGERAFLDRARRHRLQWSDSDAYKDAQH